MELTRQKAVILNINFHLLFVPPPMKELSAACSFHSINIFRVNHLAFRGIFLI
jgi:hypothetical protein